VEMADPVEWGGHDRASFVPRCMGPDLSHGYEPGTAHCEMYSFIHMLYRLSKAKCLPIEDLATIMNVPDWERDNLVRKNDMPWDLLFLSNIIKNYSTALPQETDREEVEDHIDQVCARRQPALISDSTTERSK
jgi:hypothetical protein